MYINKQTTAKARFNLNFIEKFVNMKTTFKIIFLNLIHIDFKIFCLQMSIQIDNVSKQVIIYINKQITIIFRFNINFNNILEIYDKSNYNCYLFVYIDFPYLITLPI